MGVGSIAPAFAEDAAAQAAEMFATGNFAGAVPLYRQALGEIESAYGINSLPVADVLEHLAMSLFFATPATTEASPGRAEPLLFRALKIRKQHLGDHPDTARVLDLISWIRFANAEAGSAVGVQGEASRMRSRIRKSEAAEQ